MSAGPPRVGRAAPSEGPDTEDTATDPTAALAPTERTPEAPAVQDPDAVVPTGTPSTEADPPAPAIDDAASSDVAAAPATEPASGSVDETPGESASPGPDEVSASSPAATSNADPAGSKTPRTYPILVIAGGPVVGPHTFGNEECRLEVRRCEKTGTFLGLGGNVELRARLWKPLYAHVRGVVVGNVSQGDPVHRGAWGVGVGFGAYGRHIFGRAEYLFVDAFGDDAFRAPFGEGELGRERWGHHAGLVSTGARWNLHPRLGLELWGGLMIGPHASRTFPDLEPDERTLVTFLVGVDLFYDLVPARPDLGTAPARR